MSYKQGYVQSQDCLIYYQIKGSGPPLVLLMGFGADGDVWEKHSSVYQQHFKCIIIDNRGVGKSGSPKGPYSTDIMAKDTLAVMDHLKIKKAHIAGISMGGAIAQSFTIAYPNRVNRLVLISTWPSFNNYATSVYENLKKLRKVAKPQDFMELLQLWIFAPDYFESSLDELKEGQIGASENTNPQTGDGFDGQLDACINHNSVNRLGEIAAPTLITIGMKDIFTPPSFSKILHDRIPNSEMIEFPTGGHVHHWEDLERFNKVTLEFLLQED